MRRPTTKELTGKISRVREFLAEAAWAAADPLKLALNFAELDLVSTDEQLQALRVASAEIATRDYAGGRPPQKSYEEATKDLEMYAFSWDSKHFSCRMYFKFSLTKEVVFIYSLHPSTEGQGGHREENVPALRGRDE